MHEPPNLEQTAQITPEQLLSPTSEQEEEQAKQDLRHNAQQQRQLEDFAIANTARRVNLPKEVSEELLRFHWCWVHPMFVFVYRPAFTRGMTLVNSSQPGSPDPPYFSETLLKVITSHCARFLNHDIYQHHFNNARYTPVEFMEQTTHDARVSLAMETLSSSSIPTIQALLQQSAREIAFGRSSQSWLYGGMAFRMAFDMGIHLPSDKLQTFVKSLSNEDIEIRKRLFWSCYTWDKALSLYLGRMPAFTPATDDIPLTFLDDFTDTDPWLPYYGEAPDVQARALPAYPGTPGYIILCFKHLCTLCVIINDLMQNVYSAEAAATRKEDGQASDGNSGSEEPFMRITRALQEWWSTLPPHLKVNTDQPPKLAPPNHIMSLNMLYHTIVILLHRPIVLASELQAQPAARSYSTCLFATAAIHDLLTLHAKTFGLGQISYLNAYCAYMAATIAVLRFERELRPTEDHNMTASRIGLQELLDVLTQSASCMPGLERSEAIIRKRMKGVVDAHLRAHRMFSPNTISQQAAAVGPLPEHVALANATAFQQISNPGIGHVFDPAQMMLQQQPIELSPPASVHSSVIPFSTTLPHDLEGQLPLPAFVDDFLPAFPGQQFPVATDYYMSTNTFGSQDKASLMGFNLDPHPRVDPNAINWNLLDSNQMANNVQGS